MSVTLVVKIFTKQIKAAAHSTAASFFRLKPNFNQLLNAKERKTMG